MRRLPVYLLIDTSGSMFGEPIEAVKAGLDQMIDTLRKDPYALETVHLSIITFAENARQLTPLTELASFQVPDISASGTTSLGEALSLLATRVNEEVIKTTYDQKGDWKPIVFLMSDGVATDSLDAGIEACKNLKLGVFVACAAGQLADPDQLKRITPTVVQLDSLDGEGIKAFFKWVSASVSAGSIKIEKGDNELEDINELPPPPEELEIV